MRVAAYLRVSTREQMEKQTIETQRRELLQYCASHEVVITRWYEDEGVSGTVRFDQRDGGAKLIRDAADGKIDAVLVYRLDRLARDTAVALRAADDLHRLGVTIMTPAQSFNMKDANDKLMFSVQSAFSGFEKELIVQRSIAGTKRLAADGVWLGGITTYGYRVEGRGREATLVVSEDPIPGFHLSEADVIREMFHLAADLGKSCIAIAEHFNRLGVPTAYQKDGRQVARGKRKVNTQGIWRAGRVNRMLQNTTYKGVHIYGKTGRVIEPIERTFPPIVEVTQWDRAQAVIRGNYLFSRRDCRHKYLLRGLIKCQSCGCNYTGTYDKKSETWRYGCNGRQQGRRSIRCDASSVNQQLEEIVWQDLLGFLRNPGEVLEQLESKRRDEVDSSQVLFRKVELINRRIGELEAERRRVLELFRKGVITAEELVEQREEIRQDEQALQGERDSHVAEAQRLESIQSELETAETLLSHLGKQLDGPIGWDAKRKLVETLVAGIRVTSELENGKRISRVEVEYRFHPHSRLVSRDNDHMGTGSPPPGRCTAPGRRATPPPAQS